MGIIGREGMVGVPVVLGERRTPHESYVQVSASGFMMRAEDLWKAMARRWSLADALLKFAYAFLVQVTRSALANSIDPFIPAKVEPIKSPVPLRRFRYDARHDIAKCPRGKVLRPGRPTAHGRFFHSRTRDCSRCSMASLCLSEGRVNKAVVISDHHPALLRTRRRREHWSPEDRRLYQRHRWRSEGFHGEAKTWHGLARAVRRGLQNMRIQAFLTAAAINLKRLAAGLLGPFWLLLIAFRGSWRRQGTQTTTNPNPRERHRAIV